MDKGHVKQESDEYGTYASVIHECCGQSDIIWVQWRVGGFEGKTHICFGSQTLVKVAEKVIKKL